MRLIARNTIHAPGGKVLPPGETFNAPKAAALELIGRGAAEELPAETPALPGLDGEDCAEAAPEPGRRSK